MGSFSAFSVKCKILLWLKKEEEEKEKNLCPQKRMYST